MPQSPRLVTTLGRCRGSRPIRAIAASPVAAASATITTHTVRPRKGRGKRLRPVISSAGVAGMWWQSAVIYQIYPRSFQDSNGDGIGDLPGMLSRLGYLVELGVDAVWVSPIFRSPMADFGYDVSNYTDVDPIFGTLADFDGLVAAAHARGLKIILDFVPNHTSDQHPWFAESRSSRTNAK